MLKIGAILPEGNEPEFEDLRYELRTRKVEWFERKVLSGNATVFWFYESELPKLPSHAESQGSSPYPQYLGDNESGHKISVLDKYLERFTGEDVRCPE